MQFPCQYEHILDAIPDYIVSKYASLPARFRSQENEWTVLAGFVAVYSPQYYNVSCDFVVAPHAKVSAPLPTVELVSLGTGSRCLGQSLLSRWGEVTADMHAEILAHRVLTRVLFDDMKYLHMFCRQVQQNPRSYLSSEGNVPGGGADALSYSPTAISGKNTILVVSKFFEMDLPIPSCLSMTSGQQHSFASTLSTHANTTPSNTLSGCASSPFPPPTPLSLSSSSICPSLLRARPRAGLSWHLYISDPPCGVAATDVPAHVQFTRHIEEGCRNNGEYSGGAGMSGYSREITEEDVWEWMRKEGNSGDTSELLIFPGCTCDEADASPAYITPSPAPLVSLPESVAASISALHCAGAPSTAVLHANSPTSPTDTSLARTCPGTTQMGTDAVVAGATHAGLPISARARSRPTMAAAPKTQVIPSSSVISPASSASTSASDAAFATIGSLTTIPPPSASATVPIFPVDSSNAPLDSSAPPLTSPTVPGPAPALPTPFSAPTAAAMSAPSVLSAPTARGRTTGAKSLAWALQGNVETGIKAGAETQPGARAGAVEATGASSRAEETVMPPSMASISALSDTCTCTTATTTSATTDTRAPTTTTDAHADAHPGTRTATRSPESKPQAGCSGACVMGLRVKAGRSDLPPALRSLSLSCSDKVARWSRVGLQTALLAHFLHSPIPLATITVGATAAHANPLSLYRAIIGRNLREYVESPGNCEISNGNEVLQEDISLSRYISAATMGIRGCVLRYRPPSSLDTMQDITPSTSASAMPSSSSSHSLSTLSSHTNAVSLSQNEHSAVPDRAGQWLIGYDAHARSHADTNDSSFLPHSSSLPSPSFSSSASAASSGSLPPPLLIISGHTFPWAKHVHLARANNLPLHTAHATCITPSTETAAIVQPPSSGYSTCWSCSAVLPMMMAAEPAKNKKKQISSVASKSTCTSDSSSLSSSRSAISSLSSYSSSSSSPVASAVTSRTALPCVWATDVGGWADVLVGKVGLRQGSKRRPRDHWDVDEDVKDDTKVGSEKLGKREGVLDMRKDKDEVGAVVIAVDGGPDVTTGADMNSHAGMEDSTAASRQGKRSHERDGDSNTDGEVDVARAVKRVCPQQVLYEGTQYPVSSAHVYRHIHAPASECVGITSSGSTPSGMSLSGAVKANPQSDVFPVLCRGRGWYGSVLQELLQEFRAVISSEDIAAVSSRTSSDAQQHPLGSPDMKTRDKKNKKDAKQHRNPMRSALLPAWLVDGAGAPSVSRLRMARVYADVLMNACITPTAHINGGMCSFDDADASAAHTRVRSSPACMCAAVICPLRVQSAHAKGKVLVQRSLMAPHHHETPPTAPPPRDAAAGTPATPGEIDSASTHVTASLCALRVVTLAEAKCAGWHAIWARQAMPRYTSYKKRSLRDMPVLLAEDIMDAPDVRYVDLGGDAWIVEMKSELEAAELFKLYGNPKP